MAKGGMEVAEAVAKVGVGCEAGMNKAQRKRLMAKGGMVLEEAVADEGVSREWVVAGWHPGGWAMVDWKKLAGAVVAAGYRWRLGGGRSGGGPWRGGAALRLGSEPGGGGYTGSGRRQGGGGYRQRPWGRRRLRGGNWGAGGLRWRRVSPKGALLEGGMRELP
ncbi:glycine-rich RNA-binding protein 7-like, partial [Cryptomeria japonica]|uniref:glycine-rich RNA-binding protein 7-like n=1 Tax=Cryptomeria japonica TaxID=3369 RepID=UPI0027DA622A